VGGIYGEIQSINLLPVLMGVVFWAHQKYLSPPPSASMSPEMEQQQKIMKIMFPLMMPIFMYAAPSGLTIYFITNSTLGILENKHIRHNAEKKGLLDPEKIKAQKAAKRAAKGTSPPRRAASWPSSRRSPSSSRTGPAAEGGQEEGAEHRPQARAQGPELQEAEVSGRRRRAAQSPARRRAVISRVISR
jgi:YidC/Oxa1 family membrane protein insertase